MGSFEEGDIADRARLDAVIANGIDEEPSLDQHVRRPGEFVQATRAADCRLMAKSIFRTSVLNRMIEVRRNQAPNDMCFRSNDSVDAQYLSGNRDAC